MQAATTARLNAEPAFWDPGCSTGNEEQQEASAAAVQPVGVANLSRRSQASFSHENGRGRGDWVKWSGSRSCFLPADVHHFIFFINALTGSGILAV